MNLTSKPIRKCNGCGLNARSHCCVFDTPRLMWDKGKCPGYMNEELLMKYKASRAQLIDAKDHARRKRQEVQALRKTENHHSGHQYQLFSSDTSQGRKRVASVRASLAYAGKSLRNAGKASSARVRQRMKMSGLRAGR